MMEFGGGGDDLVWAVFQSPPKNVYKQVIKLNNEIREKQNIGIFGMRKMVPSSVIGERTWHIISVQIIAFHNLSHLDHWPWVMLIVQKYLDAMPIYGVTFPTYIW